METLLQSSGAVLLLDVVLAVQRRTVGMTCRYCIQFGTVGARLVGVVFLVSENVTDHDDTCKVQQVLRGAAPHSAVLTAVHRVRACETPVPSQSAESIWGV